MENKKETETIDYNDDTEDNEEDFKTSDWKDYKSHIGGKV